MTDIPITPLTSAVGACFGYTFDTSIKPTKEYRYLLWRVWNRKKPLVMVFGINPSTANDFKNDATISRLAGSKGLAKHWGNGGLIMANLFPRISTDPEVIEKYRAHDERLGRLEKNDAYISKYLPHVDKVVFAWGRFPTFSRDLEISHLCRKFDKPTYVLKLNQDGSPMHPLLCPKNCELQSISWQ